MEITSLETLKKVKKTFVMEFAAFEDGTPFIAEVKRPNLMNLISNNKIPNTLLTAAMKVFKTGIGGAATSAMEDVKALKELSNLMNVIAENTLVKPRLKDFKDIGLELSEAQLVEIMQFMQGGVKGLESFRNQQKCVEDNKSVE